MSTVRIDIPNARTPGGDLLTGGQPSPAQLDEARRIGFRTIVNLRPPGEFDDWDEAARARTLGFAYINIPIAGPADLTLDNARTLADALDDLNAYPVMVHCGSGERVGALFALKVALIDGEDADTAMEIGRQAGLAALAGPVREKLNQ